MSFYVTFPLRLVDLAKKYSKLNVETLPLARKAAFDSYGPEWAFIYSEEDFKGQPEKYGLTLHQEYTP